MVPEFITILLLSSVDIFMFIIDFLFCVCMHAWVCMYVCVCLCMCVVELLLLHVLFCLILLFIYFCEGSGSDYICWTDQPVTSTDII